MHYDQEQDPRRKSNQRPQQTSTALANQQPRSGILGFFNPNRRDASPEELQYIGNQFVGMYDAMFMIMDIIGMSPKSQRARMCEAEADTTDAILAICNKCGNETYISDIEDFKFCSRCGQGIEQDKTVVVKCEYNFCPWEYRKDCKECSHNKANQRRG